MARHLQASDLNTLASKHALEKARKLVMFTHTFEEPSSKIKMHMSSVAISGKLVKDPADCYVSESLEEEMLFIGIQMKDQV